MHRTLVLCLATVILGLQAAQSLAAEPSDPLWQIGQPDDDTAEFALAPDGYARFGEDPLFVVGQSDPRRDWPYVHPGPSDVWAGGRSHDYSILFGLSGRPAEACRLVVDLVDTHHRSPSRLEILVNGHRVLSHQTPRGGPDDTVYGDPSQGREHRFDVEIPADCLARGTNEITIRTAAGSWILYDWLGFEAPGGVELEPVANGTFVRAADSPPLLVESNGQLEQIVELSVRHIGPPVSVVVRVGQGPAQPLELGPATKRVEVRVPAVDKPTPVAVEVRSGERTIATHQVILKPVRKWELYLLPHSHTDIGYTKVQTEVERDHWRFYEEAIEAIRRTAEYPPEARFKWNVEVLWAVDSYLKQASPEKKEAFIQGVREGWIGLDALYGNELTALCRPEELVRLVDFAGRLSEQLGVTIDSAMITDVPGYTWGITTVLSAAGVRYFSIGPNSGHRIGYTLQAWGDKPFYWVTPTGGDRILCWIPRTGYYRAITGQTQVLELVRRIEASGYPYDMIQVRYCLGDNAGPGVAISDLVRDWNARYAYPKLVIATTSRMLREFERRYGDKVPAVRGDFTPYWEDGAASSARETGLNRAAAERLTQAEAIWSILDPATYPDAEFYTAWRNVILYDEHTWGAYNSVSEPDSDFAKAQWAIKQSFALEADRMSRRLLARAAAPVAGAAKPVRSLWVFNTASWPRTDLVTVPKEVPIAGLRVTEADGAPVPSQRLSSGQLAFLASNVPPLGAKRFRLAEGPPESPSNASVAAPPRLANQVVQITVDQASGAITSLTHEDLPADLVDRRSGVALNAYRYVAGRDPSDPKPNGPVTIRVKEPGPLVASLVIQSDAPGCRRLIREVRLTAGQDYVELLNVVDKEKVREKEGVHFGFAFHVPEGVMRMDIPFAVIQPEADQLPGACKNYFTVSRWVDVSSEQFGVTWATIDAPLVEVGRISVDVPNWRDPNSWIKHLEPSQTLYSYVMNNYWETNYKADQEGPTPFRYALLPHAGPYDPVAAARFGIERSQPLVAVPAADEGPGVIPSRLRVEPDQVVVTALKPSRDGKALIVRLFNVSPQPARAELVWADPQPAAVRLSDLGERPGIPVDGPVDIPRYGLVTLRAERAARGSR
ncbi:MAG TPA: hypothetical protein EYP56_14620 [Planctomycetaceae bacterium]|nr:hypothetical protein [Planctomycetaceae bacterium]